MNSSLTTRPSSELFGYCHRLGASDYDGPNEDKRREKEFVASGKIQTTLNL